MKFLKERWELFEASGVYPQGPFDEHVLMLILKIETQVHSQTVNQIARASIRRVQVIYQQVRNSQIR
jgi:hypothetical protein